MNYRDRNTSTLLIGLPVLIIVFFVGLYLGEGRSPVAITNLQVTDRTFVSTDDFSIFWKAWQVLDDKFVNAASTTDQEKIWGSVQGLASSYGDPYTVFFPPEEAKSFQEDISGNFEGVGIEIGIRDGHMTVVTPIKNSPADRADVRTGDIIIEINGKSTVDMAVDEAVKLIRGEKGTPVKVTLLRQGSSTTIEKTIIRDVIDIPTIESSVKPDGISVIRLYSFTSQSPNLFRGALREFIQSGNHKLILDLRGNPGGYLDAAWDIASWFLPAGKTVVTEDFGPNATPKVYRSKGYDIFTDKLRMLILVDGGSASASEILAGALKEHKIAKLVGTKTFGKGSVQELVSLTPDTSLKVTIARWLTPNGLNLSKNGLTPDYEVKVTDKDREAEKDPVLDKALEILRAER